MSALMNVRLLKSTIFPFFLVTLTCLFILELVNFNFVIRPIYILNGIISRGIIPKASPINWKVAPLPEGISNCVLNTSNCVKTLGSWDRQIFESLSKIDGNHHEEARVAKHEVVILPFFQYCYFQSRSCHLPSPYKHDAIVNMLKYMFKFWESDSHLGKMLDSSDDESGTLLPLVIPMSHDYGGCGTFSFDYVKVRKRGRPEQLANVIVLSPNGDIDEPCYRPGQDIVVPPFSIVTSELIARFGYSVPSMSDRQIFIFFAGTTKFSHRRPGLRSALVEKSYYEDKDNILVMGKSLETSEKYLDALGNSQFCLISPGVVGWTGRLGESLYAGCVPVLVGMQNTSMPFDSILSYGDFTVTFEKEWEGPEHAPEFVQELEKFLKQISQRAKRYLQVNGRRYREYFIWDAKKFPASSDDKKEREKHPWVLIELEIARKLEARGSKINV